MDEKKPPESPSFDPSGLDLDLPPPPLKSSPSNPKSPAVRSAMRAQPLAPAPKKKLDKAAIQEGAIDTLLNSVSILAEVLEDFRNSDRFFKYKFAVLVAWVALSATSVTVACGNRGPTNDIHARLVRAGEPDRPVYLVKNESPEPWVDVEVLVNGKYRATLATMEPNGGSITLSPAVLFDEAGNKAPSGLIITDIEVSVIEPSETVQLLRGGEPVK